MGDRLGIPGAVDFLIRKQGREVGGVHALLCSHGRKAPQFSASASQAQINSITGVHVRISLRYK